MWIWEQGLDGLAEAGRQTVRQIQRRIVPSSFDRDDRLPGDANLSPELFLRPAALRSQLA